MASLDLCSTEDVREIVPWTDDAALARVITQTSDWLERYYLQRRFITATGIVEIHDGAGYELYVRQPPVTAVTTIEFYITASTWQSQDLTYIVLDYSRDATAEMREMSMGKVYLRNQAFPWGRDNVRITYNGGLSATTAALPVSLRRGAAMMVARTRTTGRLGGPAITSRTDAAGETLTVDSRLLTDEIRQLLDPYRSAVALGAA